MRDFPPTVLYVISDVQIQYQLLSTQTRLMYIEKYE